MNILNRFAARIAAASNGNPLTAAATVFLFYIAFNLLEALIETLIFGDRFEHRLDPFFVGAFIFYAAYTVWLCAEAELNKGNDQ